MSGSRRRRIAREAKYAEIARQIPLPRYGCPTCQGRGWILGSMGRVRCHGCHGTGVRENA